MKRKKDWAKIKQQDNWKIGREEMILTESDNNPTLVGIILFFLYLISYFLSNMRDNTIKIIYPIRNDSHRQNGCWHYGRRKHYPPPWGIVQLSLLLGENNLRKFEFHIIFFFLLKNYTVFRDDCLRVRTSVAMDVLNSFVQSLDHFDGALETSVLGA